MNKGLIATLFVAAASFSGIQASYALAPTVRPLPDVTIGDAEDNIGTDNNYFVYTNAFAFNKASDDTSASASLRWTYAEQGSGAPRYRVNDKDQIGGSGDRDAAVIAALSDPTSDIFDPEANENLQQGPISGGYDASYASFRDVSLSPGWGPLTAAFPDGADNQAGKIMTFFVSDGSEVASESIMVYTFDDENDSKTPASDFTPIVENEFPNSDGWLVFGTEKLAGTDPDNAGATPTLSEDLQRAAHDATYTALRLYVNSSGGPSWGLLEQFRIIGWREKGADETPQNSTNELKYSSVGSDNWIRAKFHIWGTPEDGSSDLNKVPNMRLRIGAGFDFANLLNLEHHASGATGAQNAAYAALAPGLSDVTPSVYRVDLDPPEISAFNTPALSGFQRIFEAYAKDSEPQEKGFLYLTESSAGVYPAQLDAAATTLDTYSASEMGAGVGGGAGQIAWAGIVYNGNLVVQSAVANGAPFPPYAQTPSNQINVTGDNTGLVMTTSGVDGTLFGALAVDFAGGSFTNGPNAERPRIEAGKQYRMRFTVTTTNEAGDNPLYRFRARTVGFQFTQRLEVGGGGGGAALRATQYLPGIGSENPSGNYDVHFPTPIGTIKSASSQTALVNEAGPGDVAASLKDIGAGVDILDSFTFNAAELGYIKLVGISLVSWPLVEDE